MTIKTATLIALCGNVLVLLIDVLSPFTLFFYRVFGGWTQPVATLAGAGTIVLFMFTLYRKQP